MKVLKSKIFNNGDDGGLVNFVNELGIAKNDIQQIVYNGYQFILFYWYTLPKEKYDYLHQKAVNDREGWK